MVRVISCQECGNDFYVFDKKVRKYCSENCKSEANKRLNRWNRQLKKARTNGSMSPTKNNKSVQEISKIARENGMSYGQWVALEYAKKVKVGC